MMTKLFKWLVLKSKYEIVRNGEIDDFIPFRVMESTVDKDRRIKFSIMKDRRKSSYLLNDGRHRFFLSTNRTFLVLVEVHADLPKYLHEYNTIQLIAMNVIGSVFFSDKIISEVLVGYYLDMMIKDLEK